MKLWTDVLTENVAVVHVGTRMVLTPLSEDVTEDELMEAKRYVGIHEVRRNMSEMHERMERRRRARERLREAGYEEDEIPL